MDDVLDEHEVANFIAVYYHVVIALVLAAEYHHAGIVVTTYVLDHAVIIEDDDINLPPEDLAQIGELTHGYIVAIANHGAHPQSGRR